MHRYGPPADARLFTVAEFERLEEEDGYELELDRGRLVREPRPGAAHGWLQLRLGARLQAYVEREKLGLVVTDAGVVLSEAGIVRGPDSRSSAGTDCRPVRRRAFFASLPIS